ncbi:hypothetical protein NLO98_26440 [Pseudomonas syringae]|nr:hypothetical protein [Pseudomonas syringae]
MINISHPSLTSVALKVGKPDKPSVSANLHVADNISMGAKMHFPGPWLDKKRASLSPLQQKMFDVALKVLSGEERPKSVRASETGREIELDRPAHGATTLSIGLEKPMSEVLDYLGMSDGKGRALLTLGTKMANAVSPPPTPPQPESPAKSTHKDFLKSGNLSATILGNLLNKTSSHGRQNTGVNNAMNQPQQSSATAQRLPTRAPLEDASANVNSDVDSQGPRVEAPQPSATKETGTSRRKPSTELSKNSATQTGQPDR